MTRPLTPYDTGARAEPKVWEKRHIEDDDDYGKVDFDADSDYTIATLHIEKGEDGYVLSGSANEPLKVDIDFQDNSDEVMIIQPSAALRAKVKEVIDNLDCTYVRESAEVYWQEGQALIIAPGEKHVRKQLAITVHEPGCAWADIDSAYVKDWATGIRETRIE